MSEQRYSAAAAVALGLWGVGVLTHEALATTGAILTAVVALGLSWRSLRVPTLERWWPLLALVVVGFVAPLLAGRFPTGTGAARWADWLFLIGASAAVRLTSPSARVRAAVAVSVVLLISCVAAATQYAGVWPKADFFASLAWTRLPFARVYELAPGSTEHFMAGGLLLHRLKFANTGALAVVLATALVVARVRGWPWFLFVAGVGGASVAVFPHARAAAVAMLVAVIATWVWGAQRRLVALFGSVGLVSVFLAAIIAVPSLKERFAAALTDQGTSDRAFLVAAGLTAVGAHPLTGEGLGRFKPSLYAKPDAPPSVMEHQGKAHNQFLSVAAEAGLFSALGLLVWLGLLLTAGLKVRPEGIGSVGAVLCVGALCVLHDPLFHPESSLAIMLALGVTHGLALEGAQKRASSTPRA